MGQLTKRETFPVAAVVSAIFPGVGQILKGHFFKAIGIWIVGFIAWALFSWWIWIPGAIVYFGQIVDALMSKDKEGLF